MEEDPKHQYLQAQNITAYVSGYWLRHYAADFLSAASTFEPPATRFSPVPYYLICHSLELSLKAFLYSAGFDRRARKRLGHDLERALCLAERNGLGSYIKIAPDERDLLRKANRLYPKKEFEYFESLETIYDPHEFDLESLASFADRLLQAIEWPVRQSVFQ